MNGFHCRSAGKDVNPEYMIEYSPFDMPEELFEL
jgi:hypothetical protein